MNVNVSSPARVTANKATPFEAERIGRHLGAEIHGLDLKQGLNQATYENLLAALTQHKVIILRDQHLDTRQHVEISRMFGELEVHPFRPQGEFPEILVLDNHKDNPVLSTDVWHSDTTFRQRPTKYTILRCQIMPKTGGDTLWCDVEKVYENLSAPFRAFIDPLKAWHDFKNFRVLFTRSDADQERLRAMEDLYPSPLHPVVRTHPISGRRSVYVNPQFTLRIDGLNEDESDSVLKLLYEQVHTPEYQFRLRWSEGALIMWDNMSTQHYAANDYYPDRRRMERTAVCGDVPV